ncbi:Choline transporter-like [Dillenia turbinata]|uniref:Choline transporter-like protein n=1 Tax=Dillenia turbinata TaxID=194707 RepID=A0AAN8ZTM3_9MAGN
MAGTEESSKDPILLYDSSSSATQPLLSSKPYPDVEQQTHEDSAESDQTQYLQISYNYSPRQFKDLPFLILFILFVLCTYGFGIFAVANKNSDYSNVSSYVYDSNSSSCVEESSSLSLSGLGFSKTVFWNAFLSSSSSFVRDLIWVLVITAILSIPICYSVLLLLKHYTKQVVYVSIPFFVLIPIFFNVYWFVACTVNSSCRDAFPLAYRILVLVFVFLVIGIMVWIIVANWHRIELTVRVVTVASHALSQNLSLFGVLPGLTLGLVVYFAPIIVFLVFARFNGEIVVQESSGEYSCGWKQDSWVPAYFALAILTMLWSVTVMIEIQVYVISGTVAQWYFSKDDSRPKKSIRSSLRNAFGPSSGTICLSGLLICAVRVVRAVVDSARQEEASGIVNVILRCCVNTFVAAIDFLNKFTINFAAITGEAYCTSARMTYELLKRNLLSAVVVETVSTRLLAGIIFVLSAIYATVVWGILKGVDDLGVYSYYVALLAWALLIVVLGFFAHVLDNVIDTVYVCYAIDRDRGEVCKQDVHEVYVHLPISRNSRSLPSRTPLA